MKDRLHAISVFLVDMAGWALICLSLLIAFEVVARKFFAFSTQGADEIGGYVLAISSAAAFSYGVHTKAHIRIDVVLRHLPVKWRATFNVVAYATLTLFAVTLAWQASRVVLQSWQFSALAPTPLAIPLILPQGIWGLGILLFAVVCVVTTIRAVSGLLRGHWERVAREFSPTDVRDDVAEEIAAARRRRDSLDFEGGTD
jgi:TRAP-type C4-dicarboxylate transport system permease small subunit